MLKQNLTIFNKRGNMINQTKLEGLKKTIRGQIIQLNGQLNLPQSLVKVGDNVVYVLDSN